MSRAQRAEFVLTHVWKWLHVRKDKGHLPWVITYPTDRQHIEQYVESCLLLELEDLIRDKARHAEDEFPD